MVFGAQAVGPKVVYRLVVATVRGVTERSVVRTDDGVGIADFLDENGRKVHVSLTPHLEGSHVDSEVKVEVGGAPALSTTFLDSSQKPSYLTISPTEHKGVKFLVVNGGTSVPKIKSHETAVSIVAELQPRADEEFIRVFKQATETDPRQVTIRFEVSNSKGTISKPVVRTLDGGPCRISMRGTNLSYDIQAVPLVFRDGTLSTRYSFSFDDEEPIQMVTGAKTPNPFRFIIRQENHGLTHRVVAVTGRRHPRLQPDDRLIEVSAKVQPLGS